MAIADFDKKINKKIVGAATNKLLMINKADDNIKQMQMKNQKSRLC